MNVKIRDRYNATMVLHALGDTIGFKNGKWEFFPNNSVYNATLEKLYEFIDLGGINLINLKDWNVSDDTLLHMSIARSLILVDTNDMTSLITLTSQNLVKTRNAMEKDKDNGINRYIGNSVNRHLLLIQNGMNWRKFEFDPLGGGNGAAMRCNCIGLAFFGAENRDKLIQYAIESSKMTHPNPIGWLGGLSTALFTAFAIEGISITKWIPLMISLLENIVRKRYINTTNEQEYNAYEQFIQCWKTYYDSRFSNGEPIKMKSHLNLIQRLIFYNNIFEINTGSKMGLSGYSAVIVAYDCLLDSGDNWEKLVIYAMINNFDSDTIGSIAGGLYGTLYGFKNVPENNLKYIEKKEKLMKIGNLLYKKYFLQEKLNIVTNK